MTETSSALFGTGEFFQRDNYAPVTDELTEFDLPVEGAIPAELDGWYLRNGPNPRQATAHWFTGDGMIHGVRIEGGRAAWYRNRWVQTDSFKEDFPLYNADGTRNLRAAKANTHVVNHAGKTLALVESSLPYEISNDLETLGAYDFGGKLVDSMTAHPKICPTTGELHFFGYGNIFEPHVSYHRADAWTVFRIRIQTTTIKISLSADNCLHKGPFFKFVNDRLVVSAKVIINTRDFSWAY